MSRKLDDTKIGEYKTSWGLIFIYTILIVGGFIALFLLPFTALTNNNELVFYSPVSYIMHQSFKNMYGYTSIAYIAFFAILFINLFMSLSINKIGKGVASKIFKVIEFILGLACIGLHATSLILAKGDFDLTKCFFYWAPLILAIVILALVIYYNIKKISIYD